MERPSPLLGGAWRLGAILAAAVHASCSGGAPPAPPPAPPVRAAPQAPADASAPTQPQACLVAPDATAPSAPPALEARLVSPGQAQLRWGAAADDVGVSGYEVVRDGEVVAVSWGTSARLPGLAPARSHCFAVRALDAAGNRSAPGPVACLTPPDVTPPSAPSGLEAVATAGRIDLRWRPGRDDAGVTAYEVRRDGATVARASRTSAAELGEAPAARRCYTVVALDAAGNRSAPSEPACAAQPDVKPPSAPDGLEARPEGETAVSLLWNPARDDVAVVRYEVLRQESVVATTPGTRHRLAGLEPAVEYCQAVRACDAAGNCSAPSAPACVTTPDLTPPARVDGVAAQVASDRSVALRWAPARDNVGVVRYRVKREGAALPELPGEATRLEDQGLSPATRYCYSVVAVDAAGNASTPSQPACATTPDLVPPTAPRGVETVARSPGEVLLRWKESTDDVGVAGYEVLRDGQVMARADGLRAAMAGLGPAAEWCHAVRAYDAAGNRSEPSAFACARTPAEGTPTAPSGLAAHVTPQGELLLTWEPSPEPGVSYVVYWDARGKGDRRAGATPTTSFKVFGRAAAERHCYRVAAVDPGQRESPRTFPVCGSAGAGLSAEAR